MTTSLISKPEAIEPKSSAVGDANGQDSPARQEAVAGLNNFAAAKSAMNDGGNAGLHELHIIIEPKNPKTSPDVLNRTDNAESEKGKAPNGKETDWPPHQLAGERTEFSLEMVRSVLPEYDLNNHVIGTVISCDNGVAFRSNMPPERAITMIDPEGTRLVSCTTPAGNHEWFVGDQIQSVVVPSAGIGANPSARAQVRVGTRCFDVKESPAELAQKLDPEGKTFVRLTTTDGRDLLVNRSIRSIQDSPNGSSLIICKDGIPYEVKGSRQALEKQIDETGKAFFTATSIFGHEVRVNRANVQAIYRSGKTAQLHFFGQKHIGHYIDVKESQEELARRMDGNFATLHTPVGEVVLINLENVQRFKPVDPGAYQGANSTVVFEGGVRRSYRESPSELQVAIAIPLNKLPKSATS